MLTLRDDRYVTNVCRAVHQLADLFYGEADHLCRIWLTDCLRGGLKSKNASNRDEIDPRVWFFELGRL